MTTLVITQAESLNAGIAQIASDIEATGSTTAFGCSFEGDDVVVTISNRSIDNETTVYAVATLANNPTVIHTRATEMAAVELWMEHGWRRCLQPEADGSIRLTL